MNFYNYFNDPQTGYRVPSKNEPLFCWIVAQTKIWNCPRNEQEPILKKYETILQDDETIDPADIKKQVRSQLRKNIFTLCFWKDEFGDLFSFLFVYWVCAELLWPCVFVRLIEHKPMIGSFALTLGEVLKVAAVYIVYKLVLAFMSLERRRDKLMFWIPFIGLFLLYLGSIYCANQFANIVLFHCSLLAVTIVFGILFLIEWYKQKEMNKRC